MGNSVGKGKKAKVMKITGETLKLKTPAKARDVLLDYPGYVLLDSDAVKHFGIRAEPLDPEQELKRKKVYFLVELPKFPEEKEPRTRRVRSGIQMSAKDRLECLMLSKRSVSDLTAVSRPVSTAQVPDGPAGSSTGPVRVKVRLPRAQVEKLVEESKDEVEVAEKIIDLYVEKADEFSGGEGGQRHLQWKPELSSATESFKRHKKHVSFVPDEEAIV